MDASSSWFANEPKSILTELPQNLVETIGKCIKLGSVRTISTEEFQELRCAFSWSSFGPLGIAAEKELRYCFLGLKSKIDGNQHSNSLCILRKTSEKELNCPRNSSSE